MKKAQELPTQICKASLPLALQKAHPVTQNHAPVGATRGGLWGRDGAWDSAHPRAASLVLSLCFPWGE